ncbi:MAG TPA: 2Fe-2S iron-sulfur cluster binding domain-containing protein [Sulfurovum sp.]|nr:2Fe-2S iron-sulfur cluster binding domain-containing protein [Sulfurovum sp.]
MGVIKTNTKAITVTIDGKECQAEFGQTILEIARANGLYIPTMCYLTKVEPIASCRMCVVEVEGVEGMILSCQERAVDGAVVKTDSDELYQQRQSIMKMYGVNHPLECGVCDKSGECDLQNKTLEFDIAQQSFAAKDQHRPVQDWGFVSYDPSLCIMCEKCVRVSNEITGNGALQIRLGGYHSTIVNAKMDPLDMSLGESAAVCPVGALVLTDFKYSTNAWELDKIPATCSHCSGGCQIHYEVKNDMVYRVTNDFEHTSACSSARFIFDFANKDVKKDEKAFAKSIEAFKSAGSIIFGSSITNEEALILQKLKEKYGYKLISHEANSYQKFLTAYSSITGKHLYGGNLEGISQSDAILVLGTRVNDDSHQAKYHMTMASKRQRAKVIYMHSIEDSSIQNIVTQFIKYEVQSEEGVVALLADELLRDIGLPRTIRDIFDDLDIGNLSAESNVGEEELEELSLALKRKKKISLIVGSDLYAHPRAENIAKMLAILEKYLGFSVTIIPPSTNTLGVALICDLDNEVEGSSIGYNAKADFVLSSAGDGDLDMPALNQQEGTFTSLDRRVVPTNVAVSYGGYTLNDIANALDIKSKYTINYTAKLPTGKGYRAVEFDNLPDYFDVVGNEFRGYLLDDVSIESEMAIDEVEELDGYDGIVVYNCDTNEQIAKSIRPLDGDSDKATLLGSNQFAVAAKLSDGESIQFTIDAVVFDRVFRIDTSMKGTIALNPVFDMGLSRALLSSYRFSRLKFQRVGE